MVTSPWHRWNNQIQRGLKSRASMAGITISPGISNLLPQRLVQHSMMELGMSDFEVELGDEILVYFSKISCATRLGKAPLRSQCFLLAHFSVRHFLNMK